VPLVRYTTHLDDGELHRDFTPMEFLAELQMHVPDLWEQTVRFTGVYSARTRGKKRRDEYLQVLAANPLAPLQYQGTPNRPSQQWAIWIKRVFEVDDPLKCPKCGGRMKIKSFIHNPQEIARLTKHLDIQAWRAPPAIAKTSKGVQSVDFDYC